MHDIGKNIVVALLRANGYDVVDLGRDVPVDEVVAAVEKEKPLHAYRYSPDDNNHVCIQGS